MGRWAGRGTVLLVVCGLVMAGAVADVIFDRDEFPSAAVVLAAFVASAFLSVWLTALVSLVVGAIGVTLAVRDYVGAGRVTRIVFFAVSAAIAVAIAVIRTRREDEIAGARVDLARRESEIDSAHRFQRALLPQRLPESDLYELSSRYRAAAADAEVGGDWFDAIEANDALTLIIGDVTGNGLEAAATMAAARHATAMAALRAERPAQVLEAANDYVRRRADTMATCMVIRFDLSTGAAVASSAGHPPIVVLADGGAELVEVPPGVPLGTTDGYGYHDVSIAVGGGSTVVLYTDGLIERRAATLDDGLDRLVALTCEGARLELETLCDRVLAEFADGDDDVALLAVRFSGHAFTGAERSLATPVALPE